MPESYKPIREALAMAARSVAVADNSGANDDKQLVRVWLRAKAGSEHTRDAYERDWQQFRKYMDKNGLGVLAEVTVAHIAGYREALLDQYAETSAARKLAAIKSLLTFANSTGYLPFNVGLAVARPRVHSYVAQRTVDHDELKALWDAAPAGRDRALLVCLYYSGARLAELTSLSWDRVQFREDGARLTLHGKGHRTRHVFIPVYSAALLNALHRVRLSVYVFETRAGRKLAERDVQRVLRAAQQRASIDKQVSPHWLRHSHATHAARRGAPVHLVQQTLGHASLSTTSMYLHAEDGESSGMYLE
jgi:integrase/recombinase XerD